MTVITSKESTPYLYAWEKYREQAEIEVMADYIIWKFKSNDEADKAANLFMNLGFEYVNRVI